MNGDTKRFKEILEWLKKKYPEFLDWDPEVLKYEIIMDGEFTELLWEKTNALLVLLKTDRWCDDAALYHNIVMVASNVIPIADLYEYVEPEMISWGNKEIKSIVEEDPQWILNYEPIAYTAVCLKYAGFRVCPISLSYASEVFYNLFTPRERVSEDFIKEVLLVSQGKAKTSNPEVKKEAAKCALVDHWSPPELQKSI